MEKYIVTVGTNYGTEVACTLEPRKEVGTLEEIKKFMAEYARDFPSSEYRIYKLEEQQQ